MTKVPIYARDNKPQRLIHCPVALRHADASLAPPSISFSLTPPSKICCFLNADRQSRHRLRVADLSLLGTCDLAASLLNAGTIRSWDGLAELGAPFGAYGRASVFHLYPLTHVELGDRFDLEASLAFGTLPDVALENDDIEKRRFLSAYVQTYLKEEIIAEQIVRNLPPFRRFLDVAAQQNAEIVHYTNIAKDVGSDPKTISKYFDILQDTLIGMLLPAFDRSVRRQQKTAPKFYFFDAGIVRALTGEVDHRPVTSSTEYGKLFETFIINETHRILTYKEQSFKLSYIRLNEKLEVDLVLELPRSAPWLCEIKSAAHVDDRHVAGVVSVGKKLGKSEKFLISNDKQKKVVEGVTCMHWREWFEFVLRA